MRAIIYLLNLIIFFVEKYIIFFKIIKFEQKNHLMRYIILTICSLIILFIFSSVSNSYIDIIGISISTVLLSLMVKRKKQIPFVFIITTLLMFISSIVETIIYKLFNIDPYIWKSSIYSSLYAFIQLIIFTGIGLLIFKPEKKKYFEYELSFTQTLMFGFGIIAFLFFIDAILRITFLDANEKQQTTAFVTALISIAFYVVICLFALYSNIKTYKKDIEVLKYQSHLKMQKNYYEELLKKEEATKAFRHDLNNHLFCILNFLDNNEPFKAKEYINELINKTGSFKKTHVTGNSIIDMVINDMFGDQTDIELCWNGNIPNTLRIQYSDLVSLFYNIFNNAVQATQKCNAQKIQITGFAKIIDNTLFISVENPYVGQIKFDDFGFPQTTKIDKNNHGYGTKNIKEIVDKYNGTLEFKTEENFIIEIILMNIFP